MSKMTIRDQYPQHMRLQVTQSAADTLTFSQVNLGIALFDYAGLIINRIEYFYSRAIFSELTTNADYVQAGITGADTIDDLGIVRPQVYDVSTIFTYISGTPAVSSPWASPIVKDFSQFPGGGQLVPAQDVYIGMDSSGMSAVYACDVRLWYQIIQLKAEDYLELAQRLRVIST